MEAVVGYAFGTGKSNEALAKIVNRVRKGKLVVLQKEIAEYTKANLVIRNSPLYMDTEEVTRQAAFFLKKKNVKVVWVVAQSFLHRKKCVALLRKQGFMVRTVPGKVPFDSLSDQWWTRNKLNFFAYAVMQKLYGRKGH